MSPEEIQKKIDDLQRQLDALKSSTTIPYEVGEAFKTRLEIDDVVEFSASTKTASSETQAVNEGGAAAYNVAKPMDGFEERVVAGVTRYYPYYL